MENVSVRSPFPHTVHRRCHPRHPFRVLPNRHCRSQACSHPTLIDSTVPASIPLTIISGNLSQTKPWPISWDGTILHSRCPYALYSLPSLPAKTSSVRLPSQIPTQRSHIRSHSSRLSFPLRPLYPLGITMIRTDGLRSRTSLTGVSYPRYQPIPSPAALT